MAKQARSTLAGQLSQAGFTFPFDISNILDRAIRSGVDDVFSLAYSMIIKSRPFKRHYPGIFRANGTLKMTPAEYESYVEAAQAGARSAGLRINRRQVGRLIQRNVSADEFSFRVGAAKQIKQSPEVFNAFNQVLKSNGQRPLKNAQQVFNFLTGKGNAATYRLYEQSAIRGAAEAAGVDISKREARRLARQTAEVTDIETASKRFQDLAEQMELASVELRAAGFSERELRNIQFGVGRRLSSQRQAAERVLAQRKLALETQGAQAQVGLEGSRPVLTGAEENL